MRVARGHKTVGPLERKDPPAGVFVAVKSSIVKGGETIARARSKTFAKRIAKALNNHKPNAEGV
jgi:hypothetical protein